MADESSTMYSTSEMLDMDSSEMVDMLSAEALKDVESGITDGSENRKLKMSLDEIIMASKKKKSSPQQQQHRRRPSFNNNKYYKGDAGTNMFKAMETEAEPEMQSVDDLILANKIAGRGRGRGRSRRGRGGHNNRVGRSQPFAPYEASFARQSFNPHSRPRGGGVGPIRKKLHAHGRFHRHSHSQAGPRASVFSRLGGMNEKTQGTKILISNLNRTKVSARDVYELFSNSNAIPVLSCRLHVDNNNNFLGTAEVEFSRMEDAIEAVRNYHDVPLDGMPMKIDFME